jgi:hypothetical protein
MILHTSSSPILQQAAETVTDSKHRMNRESIEGSRTDTFLMQMDEGTEASFGAISVATLTGSILQEPRTPIAVMNPREVPQELGQRLNFGM